MAGASNFFTTDEDVANAIRLTSLFRRGAIKEVTVLKPVVAIKQEPKVRQAAEPVESVRGRQVIKPAGKAPGTAPGAGGADVATQSQQTGQDVIEAKNFTQAKEAIVKRLGISKTAVKTPALLAQVAKDNGITIKYME